MEQLVKDLFQSYTIVRIGNISWGTNPNTLLNYLRANPKAEIQKVYRHVIDKEEFQYWLQMIPVKQRNEMNVPGVRWWVPDLALSLMSNNIFISVADWMVSPFNEKREQLGLD